MQLDYHPQTKAFTLMVPRGASPSPQEIMRDYGFDFSLPRSTPAEGCLYTFEPYAAASFGASASRAAQEQLQPILTQIDASWADSYSGTRLDMPADQELSPYQSAGVRYALDRTNAIIGDEPGLGKTMQAAVVANELRAKRVAVVCPAAIRRQWVKKLLEWTTLPYPTFHVVDHGRKGWNPTANFTVVSYDLLRSPGVGTALASGYYDLIIGDELQYAKTIDSARTRAIFGGGRSLSHAPLVSRCDRFLGLTGTPTPNRARELYTPIRGLCHDAIDWMSQERFTERFNPSKRITGTRADGSTYTYIDERSGRLAELGNRLRANLMVRRLKRQVLPQLQLPVYDLVYAEATGAVKAALQAERLLDIDPDTLAGANADVLGQIATVRRQMGIALAPHGCAYVETLLRSGVEKVGIFAWHIEVLDIIQKTLDRWGVVRVDGSSSPASRARSIERFRNDPKCRIIEGNHLSLGTGTDGLQDVCSNAVLFEPDWTSGNNQQCFDRFDRIGQRRVVQGDILVARGSLSEKVLARALSKLGNIHKTLDRRVA
jgi:SWI/SNF-related matrix-associated actin-dependent regulator 1 of chromatin subfamily A